MCASIFGSWMCAYKLFGYLCYVLLRALCYFVLLLRGYKRFCSCVTSAHTQAFFRYLCYFCAHKTAFALRATFARTQAFFLFVLHLRAHKRFYS